MQAHGDVVRADPGHRDEQAAGDAAEQDRDEGAHLDHAVAAGELALARGAAAGRRT